jgi:hypothetical protein
MGHGISYSSPFASAPASSPAPNRQRRQRQQRIALYRIVSYRITSYTNNGRRQDQRASAWFLQTRPCTRNHNVARFVGLGGKPGPAAGAHCQRLRHQGFLAGFLVVFQCPHLLIRSMVPFMSPRFGRIGGVSCSPRLSPSLHGAGAESAMALAKAPT